MCPKKTQSRDVALNCLSDVPATCRIQMNPRSRGSGSRIDPKARGNIRGILFKRTNGKNIFFLVRLTGASISGVVHWFNFLRVICLRRFRLMKRNKIQTRILPGGRASQQRSFLPFALVEHGYRVEHHYTIIDYYSSTRE